MYTAFRFQQKLISNNQGTNSSHNLLLGNKVTPEAAIALLLSLKNPTLDRGNSTPASNNLDLTRKLHLSELKSTISELRWSKSVLQLIFWNGDPIYQMIDNQQLTK